MSGVQDARLHIHITRAFYPQRITPKFWGRLRKWRFDKNFGAENTTSDIHVVSISILFDTQALSHTEFVAYGHWRLYEDDTHITRVEVSIATLVLWAVANCSLWMRLINVAGTCCYHFQGRRTGSLPVYFDNWLWFLTEQEYYSVYFASNISAWSVN